MMDILFIAFLVFLLAIISIASDEGEHDRVERGVSRGRKGDKNVL